MSVLTPTDELHGDYEIVPWGDSDHTALDSVLEKAAVVSVMVRSQ